MAWLAAKENAEKAETQLATSADDPVKAFEKLEKQRAALEESEEKAREAMVVDRKIEIWTSLRWIRAKLGHDPGCSGPAHLRHCDLSRRHQKTHGTHRIFT